LDRIERTQLGSAQRPIPADKFYCISGQSQSLAPLCSSGASHVCKIRLDHASGELEAGTAAQLAACQPTGRTWPLLSGAFNYCCASAWPSAACRLAAEDCPLEQSLAWWVARGRQNGGKWRENGVKMGEKKESGAAEWERPAPSGSLLAASQLLLACGQFKGVKI